MQTAPNGGIVHAEFTDPKPASFGLTDEQAEALRDKYERVGSIRGGRDRATGGPAYQLVFRPPNRGESKRYRSMIHEPARRSEAQEMLGRACIVAVFWKGSAHIGEALAREALNEILEKYTLALDSAACSEVIEKLASGATADEEKG